MMDLCLTYLAVVLLSALNLLPGKAEAFCLYYFPSKDIIQQRSTILQAKRTNNNNKKKRKRKRNPSSNHDAKAPPPPDATAKDPTSSSAATQLAPAQLASVQEDHNHEQFFYTPAVTRQIVTQLVSRYQHPLLLCNPSLAVEAEKQDMNYLLLDRDTRFDFLEHYQHFDVTAPHFVGQSYPYDAVFLDPPFANLQPSQLVKCLKLMGGRDQWSVPVYIAYTSQREDILVKAFGELPCPPLQRLWPLQYQSVRPDMQDKIFLYGPNAI